MAETQASLFTTAISGRPERAGLILISQPSRPLTKAQRAFNRLIARIEELRARLDAETRSLDAALAYYGEHLHPRIQQQKTLRKDLIRALAAYLDDTRLKRKTEREALRMILAEQMNEVILEDGPLKDDDLRAVFERVHGVDIERLERDEMKEMRSAMEDIFGDFGIEMDFSDLRPGMSDEEFAAKAAEMAARMRHKAEEERSFGPQSRRKSKRQLENEERTQHAEEVRKKGIATIYKQLAKVLHPDLEPDAERRQHKVALMQELTAAYRNNDVHTLLRLELEWIHKEENDLDRLTDEKLAIYNQVLKQQAAELQHALAVLPHHPRYRPLTVPDGPFDFRLRTNGPAEAHQLDRTIASMKSSITRLQTSEGFQEVRAAIRAYRGHVSAVATARSSFIEDAPF